MIPHDINDNEIRVISPATEPEEEHDRRPRNSGPRRRVWILAIVVIVLFLLSRMCVSLAPPSADNDEDITVTPAPDSVADDVRLIVADARTSIADTTVNGVPLTIFTPLDATPSLVLGPEAIDSAAVLLVPAADIRADNGSIVGAFVYKGLLLSKGERKSGFCAIIGGKITIGVASSTPYLEDALENEGYFFRQYPLVVGGQIVENKPQNKSLRRALAEYGGKTVVILSGQRMTFHDFSQALVDIGVSDAIYLCGGKSLLVARTDSTRVVYNRDGFIRNEPYVNFLMWK